MTRLSRGDYLLPSNDAQTLWRIATYEEIEGEMYWGLWRWDGGFPTGEQIAAALEEGWWTDRWEFWEGEHRSRGSAAEAALNRG